MQTPTNLDNHQAWGGQEFCYDRYDTSATAHQESRPCPSSRVGFVASSSDELFHPTSGGPSTRVFALPPIPPRRPFTSCNNPSFALPPRTPVPLYNRRISRPLGLPPPIPPPHSRPPGQAPSSPCVHTVIHHPQPVRLHPVQLPVHPPSSPRPTCHGHCHSTSTITSKTLPTVTHIPLLTSKADFFAWDEGVTTLLCANGLISHILDPSGPVDLYRPDRMASPPPTLSPHPLPAELETFNLWWDRFPSTHYATR